MNDHLGFLCADVARLMRKQFDIAAREFGVTGPQWRVLVNLARFPGLNQGALADRLEVEPITTCRMVDRLEQSGLVERRRDPADRRAWQLFLTQAAMPFMDKLHSLADGMIAQATYGLSEPEIEMVATAMQRMRENLIDPLPMTDPGFPIQDVASHG